MGGKNSKVKPATGSGDGAGGPSQQCKSATEELQLTGATKRQLGDVSPGAGKGPNLDAQVNRANCPWISNATCRSV